VFCRRAHALRPRQRAFRLTAVSIIQAAAPCLSMKPLIGVAKCDSRAERRRAPLEGRRFPKHAEQAIRRRAGRRSAHHHAGHCDKSCEPSKRAFQARTSVSTRTARVREKLCRAKNRRRQKRRLWPWRIRDPVCLGVSRNRFGSETHASKAPCEGPLPPYSLETGRST